MSHSYYANSMQYYGKFIWVVKEGNGDESDPVVSGNAYKTLGEAVTEINQLRQSLIKTIIN